ncbi:unnamed protein product [Closterium sp. NIES-53]
MLNPSAPSSLNAFSPNPCLLFCADVAAAVRDACDDWRCQAVDIRGSRAGQGRCGGGGESWARGSQEVSPGRPGMFMLCFTGSSRAGQGGRRGGGEPGTWRAQEAAEQAKVDAVVVGSHGHGVLKRLVLGSVSEYCAHHCPMPVIIVRPNKIGQPDPAVPMD